MHLISPENIRTINELKGALVITCDMMNKLLESGLVVKFGFGTGPDGKQVLQNFEILAPIDLSKTSS